MYRGTTGFVLLAGADEGRCPLAAPLRPFFGFVAGAMSATLVFKWCLPTVHTAHTAQTAQTAYW